MGYRWCGIARNPSPRPLLADTVIPEMGANCSPVQHWAGELLRLFAGICGVLRRVLFAAIRLEKLEWKQWRSPRTVHARTRAPLAAGVQAGFGFLRNHLVISGFRVQVPGGVRETRASTPGFFLNDVGVTINAKLRSL